MATKTAAKKAATKTTNAKKGDTKDKPALGIGDLAKVMKLEPETVRKRLRDSGMKKSGKAWGWKNKAELETVAKKIAA